MALYTPKNIPWKPTSGYDDVNAFHIPEQPISSQDNKPCYVPDGLIGTPVKFPSIISGFQRGPVHPARAALTTRHDCQKWHENVQGLLDEASTVLDNSKRDRKKLEDLVREHEKLKAQSNVDLGKTIDDTVKYWKEKIDELMRKMNVIISENNSIQDRKRDLQFYLENIEAPLQISHDCLRYRESRKKNELANDEVEQLLIKESEILRQNQKRLEKCLKNCDVNLLQGRKMQNNLENFIRSIQYIIDVDRSELEILRLSNSESTDDFESLLDRTKTVINNLQHFQKQLEAEINSISRETLRIWTKTNDGFDTRCEKMREIINKFTTLLNEIKNEIFNVEKNLKNLKTNKGISSELQLAEDHLKSLLQTKNNLECEITSKSNSLFIDEHKCITIRKSYSVSILANYY